MRVSKWGNSLANGLPAPAVEALMLNEGDDIEVVMADDRVFQLREKPGREAILARLRQFGGKVTDDFKFDREEANAHPQSVHRHRCPA